MIKLYFTLIKSRTFILLAVLMPLLYFISSCSENKGFSPVFEDVESGIARDSLDLAMNILDSIERTHNKRESDRMEAAFLELQINDRSYKPHRSDSTIKRLLEYYIDGNRNPRLHPSLLYYAGRVYSDMGRDNLALEYFYRAIGMLGNNEDVDLESRAYAQIGEIMTSHSLYRKALHFLKKQQECDLRRGDSIWAFKTGATIAYLYRALNHKDSATMVYRELSRALPAIKDSAAVSVYTTQLVSFLIDEGRYADARALVDRSDLRYDRSTSPSVLSILSRLEWGEKNYGRVEELSRTLIADNDSRRRRSAAQYLMEISMMKHRPEEAIGYARRYVELTDSIERAETDGMISEQEDILNAYYVEGRNRGLDETIRGKETTITILYIVCGILVLTAAALSYACFRIRRRNTVSRNDESSMVRDDIPAQGIATSAGLSRLRKAILQRHLDPDHTMGREDFEWLEKELDALLPGFADRLEALGLPERDFHDAMMIRLGMSTKDCSTILGISPAALSNSRKKLLARVSPEGHDKWADYIYAL